ncbi:MAG: hypothetical protein IJV41_07855, partial [Oscillospiraceae bacterium]|nr:hypothetical protein [Oscillospiraceae bacterium]
TPFGVAFLARDRDSNRNRTPQWGVHRPVQKLVDSFMFRTAAARDHAHSLPCETCRRIPYRVPKIPLIFCKINGIFVFFEAIRFCQAGRVQQ